MSLFALKIGIWFISKISSSVTRHNIRNVELQPNICDV